MKPMDQDVFALKPPAKLWFMGSMNVLSNNDGDIY